MVVLVAALGAGFFLAAGPGHVEFVAHDRVEVGLAASLVKFEGAEHVAVVGQGQAGLAKLDGLLDKVVDADGAVEQREVAVVVEVDEGHGRIIPPPPALVKPPAADFATEFG